MTHLRVESFTIVDFEPDASGGACTIIVTAPDGKETSLSMDLTTAAQLGGFIGAQFKELRERGKPVPMPLRPPEEIRHQSVDVILSNRGERGVQLFLLGTRGSKLLAKMGPENARRLAAELIEAAGSPAPDRRPN